MKVAGQALRPSIRLRGLATGLRASPQSDVPAGSSDERGLMTLVAHWELRWVVQAECELTMKRSAREHWHGRAHCRSGTPSLLRIRHGVCEYEHDVESREQAATCPTEERQPNSTDNGG